ncbi:MAG: hypothetical protein ACD_62C00269G0003 [uncultured bacterium]|nr:MAG: hypothetical protein ACD_62C00269G0003 [uncultured bacterium]
MKFYISRYTNIEERTFDLEVVTPLFLSGADQRVAELRTASIKGMLRFWWRALYGSDDVIGMKKEENRVFGSTASKSTIKIRIIHKEEPKQYVGADLPAGIPFCVHGKSTGIIHYLFGQAYSKRNFIPPLTKFELSIQFHSEDQIKVTNTVKTFFKYGCLGSRSRNGFGSLHCHFIEHEKRDKISNEPLAFTAFSNKSTLFLFKEHNNWVGALSEIGNAYRGARLSPELEKPHHFEMRSRIALPIISRDRTETEGWMRSQRQTKSYFLKVIKTPNDKFRGQILFLPYEHTNPLYKKAYSIMNEQITRTASPEVIHAI